MKSVAQNGEPMKIKCPFCRNIYDPEAYDNTCPACNKKLMVSVFKKKPEGKPGTGLATALKTTPAPAPARIVAPPPPPPAPPPQPAANPVTEFVAPKAPALAHPHREHAHKSGQTQRVTETAHAPVPEPKVHKVVLPPDAPVEPPPHAPAPTAHAEKKTTQHGHSKTSLDLVISLQQGASETWNAVIRMPAQVFKFANLIPARAREAIESEGIDFEELRKAVEHTNHVGPLLDIQTQTQRVHIAIEPHI